MALRSALTAALALLCPALQAQPGIEADTPATRSHGDQRLAWWREARFGLFVHFGLYAVPEGRWGDKDGYGEWLLSSAQVPLDEYEALAERFTVEHFDAREWARLAKAAGMRYVVITTKHHDGFCLFDSAHTTWDVARTPFKRDVMREVADAFRAAGLRVGWYHSIMDWHHPDYLPRRPWDPRPAADADMDRYTAHLADQVTELLTRYGPIGLMWFDGQWESTWNHARGQALYDLCRRLQPDVIVNNRVDVGFGQDGLTTDARFAGDYGTPEQSIPTAPPAGVDWETCMTMNRHWGWNAADTQWKSAGELVRTLVDVVSKGGNLLLNIGPRPDGTFPPLAVERLAALGRWMDVNGQAIHGAERSPFPRPDWGRLTQRVEGDVTRLFAHAFEAEPWTSGALTLDGIGNEVLRAYALGAPDRPLAVSRDADVPGRIRVAVAGLVQDPYATVVALDLAGAPLAYLAPELGAPTATFIEELEVTVAPPSPGLGLSVEFGGRTVATDSGPLLVTLRESTTLTARTTHLGRSVGPEVRSTFARVVARPGAADAPGVAGLRLDVLEGAFDSVPAFPDAPRAARIVDAVSLAAGLDRERVAARFHGWMHVERDAIVTFQLGSDDGSRLWIGDACVVDNDGLHGFKSVRGEVALGAGWHPLAVGWINNTGGANLELLVGFDGGPLKPPGAGTLRTD